MKHYTNAEYFKIGGLPFYVERHPQEGGYKWIHTHEFVEIVFVERGIALHKFVNARNIKRSCGLVQGDVFLVMPGRKHNYSSPKNMVIYNIGIDQDWLRKELLDFDAVETLFSGNMVKVHLPLDERENAKRCLRRLLQECALQRSHFRQYAKALLVEFLLTVCRASPISLTTANSHYLGILETIRLMESAPAKTISLPELAKVAAMSIPNYTRKFRAATGTSPLAYLNNLRLERARMLLEESALSVEQIALECGFCDSNYMIKRFRLRHGLTPLQYRRLLTK